MKNPKELSCPSFLNALNGENRSFFNIKIVKELR
jgi:hypothetical protein